ncbi:MAG: hypothetical protein AUG50_00380 [Betaproteobacteria bacterium 13_1_20CM_3_63_8]|nr:MAG: hypothetical protein AUG50_00380 [Betaproteobacteria bacterium 13_1_20CM_3_63_8]
MLLIVGMIPAANERTMEAPSAAQPRDLLALAKRGSSSSFMWAVVLRAIRCTSRPLGPVSE